MSSLGISEEEAKKIVANYEEGYKATMEFAKKGEAFVKNNGYILINPVYGHRLWWWDFKKWSKRQQSFTTEFWEEYRLYHKDTGDSIAQEVKQHFQAVSKYGRLARNAPSQGSSSIMTKLATIDLFNWIVDNDYFSKILLVNITHDEINTEFPEELKDSYPQLVQSIMAKAGSMLCSKVEVPAEASVGEFWIH
jgi:DNA polymerase I-like protein with 3'-5' exonuclease and polymerase domains